jgi:hypothetical protein
MKQQIAFVLTLLVVFVVLASPSRADTNASFCAFKGYLAFEAREGTTSGVVGHVLRVVRLDPQRGIYLAGEVTLPELFTVYHLICNEDNIQLGGWNNVVTKYVIEIAKSREVRVLGPSEYPGQKWSDAAKDGPAPADLGIFGPKVAPLLLESLDPEHEYQLLRNVSGRQTKGGWEFRTKSEVVQRDLKGMVLQRLVLYESRRVENGD